MSIYMPDPDIREQVKGHMEAVLKAHYDRKDVIGIHDVIEAEAYVVLYTLADAFAIDNPRIASVFCGPNHIGLDVRTKVNGAAAPENIYCEYRKNVFNAKAFERAMKGV